MNKHICNSMFLILPGIAGVLAPVPVLGQGCPAWDPSIPQRVATRRANHAMVFDSFRGVTVLYGGYNDDGTVLSSTLEWDGSQWSKRSTAGPGPRERHAMAYDASRGQTVLFGGYTGASLSRETWVWDGTFWNLASTSGPTARRDSAMAYDPLRHVVVLFGGEDGGGHKGDTWEWNGFSWNLRSTVGPPPQINHAMVFDNAAGRTVLVGQSQTWEWNGVNWALTDHPIATTATGGHALAFDSVRDVIVLSGGGASGTQTYEWDGTSWLEKSSPYPARLQHGMAFDADRGVVVLHGGGGTAFTFDDTWTWDGNSWNAVESGSPHGFSFPAIAYDSDRGVTVLFAGSSDGYHGIWEFDGANWTFRTHVGPGYRKETAMAYDKARGVTVLFGGRRCPLGETCYRDDETWTWDGTSWTLAAESGPSPRNAHVMAYDSSREKVVLFGGESLGVGLLSDTWEWDGSAWTFMGANDVIPARDFAGMAYDERRNVMVLFGGGTNSGSGDLSDTWERIDTTWTFRTQDLPSARSYPAMAFDAGRGVVVLQGGGIFPDSETWTWNGATWKALGLSGPTGSGASMSYDALRDRMIYFPAPADMYDSYTWELHTDYDFPTAAPRVERFPPCSGSSYATKNRYISFVPPTIPSGATGIALRVTLGPMPGAGNCPGVPDFSASDGVTMWVGDEILQGSTPTGVFRLRHTPHFRDWTTVENGVIQVSDCNIVPCASYSIQSTSDVGYPNGLYSVPLVLNTTSTWGDIVGANVAAVANGIVDFIDISAAVDTFRAAPSAPRTWCDLAGINPYQGVVLNIDFLDISAVVDAFRGVGYPFSAPTAPNPCP